ncbi:hematopoietic prostaglandin D synthase-like [Branchiostoma floridae]|uniref:glutathione transferase n=1 Tax=Branchiostoma floridae TaxID=7739 RepID=A0A9J7KV25_BRAFL|nr:hematopoietic prostaglandin D synthase-like [Branchiostoma floridae]
MAPKYRLVYFNIRGRAELTRLLFAAADLQYEDQRFEFSSDQWKELKPKTPMGQLPLLYVDDVPLCQSTTIARYVARTTGLAGKTPLDEAKADMIVDGLDDLAKKLLAVFNEKDEEKKAELQKELAGGFLPQFLGNYEKLASAEGFFVGGSLTWADLAFFNMIGWVTPMNPAVLDGFSNLAKVMDNVQSQQGVARWLKERPQTKM